MDVIRMKDMEFYGHVGCLKSEKLRGQRFVISIEMFFDEDIKGCHTDNIDDTVDYSRIFDIVSDIMEEAEYDLIERLAQVICEAVLKFDSRISKVLITCSKPEAPIDGKFAAMEVTITRTRSDIDG